MKKLTRLLIVILAISFVSCLEYNEKLKLNDDGSGEITFAVGLNDNLFNMGGDDTQVNEFNEENIKKDYEDKDGIKLVDSRSYSKDGNRWIEIMLEFESLEKLQAASQDTASEGMIGKMSLTNDDTGNWVFSRQIFSGKRNAKTDSADFDPSNMMGLMFSKYKWHYELTLPSKIISTNAKQEDINKSTNTVQWTFSLASLTENQVMTVTFEKSKSSNIFYVLVGAFLLIVLSLLALNLSKKKKEFSA